MSIAEAATTASNAAAAVPEPTDWRLWVVAAVSVFSLCYNIWNTHFTMSRTDRVRRQTIRLDEFRSSVKDPIFEALKACEDVIGEAEAIATSAQSLSVMVEPLKDLNRNTIKVLSALENRLQEANDSAFADGGDWLAPFEDAVDKIYPKFNEALNDVNGEFAQRKALSEVKPIFRDMNRAIRNRIETEISNIGSA